jgi:GNAT superfamily N-acetyltransferase
MSYEIEEVERASLECVSAAAIGSLGADLGLRSQVVGQAFASLFTALPVTAIVLNRAIGLGLGVTETRESIDRIVDLYAEAGVARYFVHVHPDSRPEDIGVWLEGRGLEEARAWVKFRRGRTAPPEVRSDLEVRRAGPEDAEAFARIEADAFDLGPAAVPLMARLVGRPNLHVYMSFDGDRPAGAGVLFVKDGVGWLDWGATAPAFRGRGSQSALLRRRIVDALDLDCRMIGTTTGEEVPGEPQASYHNIVKMGFEPAYVRKNYAPPKPA